MTALDRYVRLEAVGLWREHAGAAAREVVVSFGSATLILTDLEERPLGHWALAGVTALGRDGPATVYAMTADGEETLAIRDRDMIAAIAAVARPVPGAPGREPPRRRRVPVAALALVAVLAALAVAAPRAVRAVTARMIPPELAAEFGDRMLIALIEARGAPCAAPEAGRALAGLALRLDPDDPPRLRVMALGAAPVAALPGRTLVLGREALAAATAPEEIAGWAAVGLGRAPLAALAGDAGTLADLGLVFTGGLDETVLAGAAAAAATPAAPTADESTAAVARLAAAGIDPRPFAAAAGVAVAAPGTARHTPALADSDWIALRAACGDAASHALR